MEDRSNSVGLVGVVGSNTIINHHLSQKAKLI
jgi:hypothetical protein